MILSPSQLCTLIPVADSFSISIGALKITIFSFIHTGFAIMQPLWAGRLEVNPLSHHYPYKLLSDSSAPNTETNLTSLCLVYSLHTALIFPHPKHRHKISILEENHPNVLQFISTLCYKIIRYLVVQVFTCGVIVSSLFIQLIAYLCSICCKSFILIRKINAINVLTCITSLLRATTPWALISIWLWHFILHRQ